MILGLKCLCASVLQAGHVTCLRDCKSLCNYLIVLTQPDHIIEELKGHPPPIPLEERIIILDSIKYVDEVAVYNHKTEDMWIKRFKERVLPNKFQEVPRLVLFHSEEHKDKIDIPGKDLVDEIIFIPRRYLSTTQVIDNILRDREENG